MKGKYQQFFKQRPCCSGSGALPVRGIFFVLLAIVCSVGFGGCALQRADKHSALSFVPELPERFTLSNGTKVLYLQDQVNPFISGSLLFRGGSLDDPIDQIGLSAVTGSAIREGGVAGLDPKVFDQLLDDIGASIEVSFGDESGSASFSALSEDTDRVLKLYTQLLSNPGFDAARFELVRKIAIDRIKLRNESPGTIAGIAFSEIYYGKDSIYGRSASQVSLSSITLDAVRANAKKLLNPQGAILALSAPDSAAEIRAKLEATLGQWKVTAAPIAAERPAAIPVGAPGIYLVRKDFPQAVIDIGHSGPKRLMPDMFARNIFNNYFGLSAFGSILFSEIRDKRGLAYDVSGGFFPATESGIFSISLGTRNEQVIPALSAIYDISRSTRETLPPQDNIEKVKVGDLRSFVFRFDDVSGTVRRQALLDFYGFPQGHDRNYIRKTKLVTPGDVQEIARKYLHPEKFVTVVVGNLRPEDLSRELGSQYPIYEVDF
ncbi:insulinase family protein, partial [bacterium]|nr:insulinase family protein [bacterium]